MTGTGTQTDPYLVDNIADFRTACATTDAYVKLIADLNCNKEKYLSWSTLTSNAIEVDFDGYTIKTPYIATGNGMIDGQYKTILKNGSILNIYENTASYILTKCSLYNMSIRANLYNVTGVAFGFLNGIEKCNFEIFNQNIQKSYPWISMKGDNASVFIDSRFYLEGVFAVESYGTLIGIGSGTTGTYTVMNGCRIEGIVKPSGSATKIISLIGGKTQNSIFAIDTSASSGKVNSLNIGYNGLDNTNIYQSGTSAYGNYSKAIACIPEQIRDPDYLNSIGFLVSEVTS